MCRVMGTACLEPMVGIFGTEDQYLAIRLQSCIEAFTHKQHYNEERRVVESAAANTCIQHMGFINFVIQ